MGILDLFKTSDGGIPFLQIILGLLLGIIGTFAYFKFYKPLMLSQIKEQNLDFDCTLQNENFTPTLVDIDSLPKIPTPLQKSYEELEVISEQEEEEEEEEKIQEIEE